MLFDTFGEMNYSNIPQQATGRDTASAPTAPSTPPREHSMSVHGSPHVPSLSTPRHNASSPTQHVLGHFASSPPPYSTSYGNQQPAFLASGMLTPPNRPDNIPTRGAASAPLQRVANFNGWHSAAPKHGLPAESESSGKRVKTAHTGFSGASFANNRPLQPANNASMQVSTTVPAASSAQQSTPAATGNAAEAKISAKAEGKSKEKEVPEKLAPIPTIVPPVSFKIDTIKNAPFSLKNQYPSSDEYWLNAQELIDETTDEKYLIKPKPAGGVDVGIPTTPAEVEALAKKVYDAIVDFRYLFGSRKSPTSALMLGQVSKVLIVKRSYELVNETVEFHKNGLPATVFCNGHNLTANATKLHQLKRTNEQNDTFEERMKNIIVALRHHKTICMDVIADKETLKYAIILAPRAKMIAKFDYAKSNLERGEQAKAIKKKAAELDKLKKEKEAAAAGQ